MLGFTFKKQTVDTQESDTPSDSPSTEEEQQAEAFLVRSGTVPGTAHTRKQVNNQDSYLLREIVVHGERYIVGIVSDGCTGKRKKSRTEIGSGLLTLYTFSEIRTLLTLNAPPSGIPASLYPRCVSYVGNIARSTVAGTPEEMASFIENTFLCTLAGFIMSSTELVLFKSGDGLTIINDRDILVDQNDQPLYLGYHQIDRSILGSNAEKLPSGFDVQVLDLTHVNQFAIGTDGLVKRDKDGTLYIDPEERESIFSYQREAPAGLQWWLNKQQNRCGRFDDDTSLITVERKSNKS